MIDRYKTYNSRYDISSQQGTVPPYIILFIILIIIFNVTNEILLRYETFIIYLTPRKQTNRL